MDPETSSLTARPRCIPGRCEKIPHFGLAINKAVCRVRPSVAIPRPGLPKKMSILRATFVLAIITAIVGMAAMAVAYPPLAFFAVPVSMLILALAVGV